MRRLELRRHAVRASQGDELSAEGVESARRLGERLDVRYTHLFTSPALRAAQTLAAVLAGYGRRVPRGPGIIAGLLSPEEDRWRAAGRAAGSGSIEAVRRVDPDLVAAEAERLGALVRRLLSELPDGAYALAIGHSPLIECAGYALSGRAPEPLRPLEGLLVTLGDDGGIGVGELRVPQEGWP